MLAAMRVMSSSLVRTWKLYCRKEILGVWGAGKAVVRQVWGGGRKQGSTQAR